MNSISLSIPGPNGVLAAVLHLPESADAPLVAASHGLLSSKESDKFVELGRRLASIGIRTLRFDYSGCGESAGSLDKTTVTGRLADLAAVIRWVRENHRPAGDRLGLMGSSLGGYVSLLTAARDPGVRGVVAWATPYVLKARRETIRQHAPQLGPSFFEDLSNHDLPAAIRSVSRVLVIHGEQDELVPCEHARVIYEALREPKALEIVPSGDHRFLDSDLRDRAFTYTEAWFKRFLL